MKFSIKFLPKGKLIIYTQKLSPPASRYCHDDRKNVHIMHIISRRFLYIWTHLNQFVYVNGVLFLIFSAFYVFKLRFEQSERKSGLKYLLCMKSNFPLQLFALNWYRQKGYWSNFRRIRIKPRWSQTRFTF